MNVFLYSASQCFKNLLRQRTRFRVLALSVIIVSSAVSFTASFTESSKAVLNEYLPYYAPDGYYIAEEDAAKNLPLTPNDVRTADRINAIFFKLQILCSAAWGAALLTYAKFSMGFRIPDAVIMNHCGVGTGIIAGSLFAETLARGIFSYITGILLGYLLNLAVFSSAAPPFMVPAFPSAKLIFTGIGIMTAVTAANTAMFAKKIKNSAKKF